MLDSWINKTIKTSLIGTLITKIISLLSQNIKPLPKINVILLVSIHLLFIALILPQFANDRFGIGILILCVFFIFTLNVLSNKITAISFNSLDFCLLIFLCIACISTFTSYFLKESLTGYLKYFIYALFFFILRFTLVNISYKNFSGLLYTLFSSSVIVAIIGIKQYITGVEPLATWEDPSIENIHTRVYSTLGNPNLLAGYLLASLPLGIGLIFLKDNNLFAKFILTVGSLLVLFCLLFTGSRGGYLGLFSQLFCLTITFSFYLIKSQRSTIKLFLFVLFIVCGTALIMLVFPHIVERLSTLFTLREHSSNNFRINVWLASLNMLKDNWLIGIGPGNSTFLSAYGLYMVTGFDALSAYNIFLETAIELGILGCLVLIFIFFISFVKLYFLSWKNNNMLSFGIFVSLIGLLTHGMVDTVFFRPQIFIPFFFLLASIDKLESKGRGDSRVGS